jgi:hypothetical protein
MSTVDFNKPFSPSLAENGKFVPIDMSTITGYPSTYTNGEGLTGVPTNGRFAVLTYNIGTDTSNLILSGGLPNTTNENLLTFVTNSSSSLSFSPAANLMEISNRSNGSIYITYSNPPTTNFGTLTAAGLEIPKGSFYSIERTTTLITIGSVAGGNVVVFGHYKS